MFSSALGTYAVIAQAGPMALDIAKDLSLSDSVTLAQQGKRA